jgi:hypothetical protein
VTCVSRRLPARLFARLGYPLLGVEAKRDNPDDGTLPYPAFNTEHTGLRHPLDQVARFRGYGMGAFRGSSVGFTYVISNGPTLRISTMVLPLART